MKKTPNETIDELNYHETLSDFSSCIQELGAGEVAQAFEEAFPQQFAELLYAGFAAQRKRRVAALFRPS